MNILKVVLLLLPVAFVYFAFIQTKTTHVKAYQRILFLGFIAFVVLAFVDPSIIRKLARWTGFEYGAYLLIYVVIVAFIFSIIAIYLKFNEMSHKIVKLSRQLAFLESEIEKNKKK